ncbi:CBS domain-containing protein [Candidatus Saccharibacteria bacterium]|nr:CBS domain-containing protein [Candidatus Saccharibacteria bacterium]
MLVLLIIGFMASVALTSMSLALKDLSTSYLRYWARKGDVTSKSLYPLKSRGSAVLLTIELCRAIVVSGTLVLLASQLWNVFAWLIGAVILFAVFIVLGELFLKPLGIRLLVLFNSWLLGLSQILKFITNPLGRVFDRFLAEQPIIMTRSELTHNLASISPSDTDLSADELRILKHALSFGEKTVHDIMTPRSVVTSVKEDEVVSPLLLDELHKSGHSRFPVMSSNQEHALGLLYLRDLLEHKDHIKVSELMHSPIHYVNEDRELDHVLQAFLRTKQHMFLVVNGFAEVVGLVTIEDVVEQVLGKPIIDEFDKYDSMRDVADAKAKVVREQIKVVE